MALLGGRSAVSGSYISWKRERFENLKLLAAQLDELIFNIQNNPTKSYQFNDGQTSQAVSRQDIPYLVEKRKAYDAQLAQMADELGIGNYAPGTAGKSCVQVVPLW